MPKTVNSYRFIGKAITRMVKAWIELESPRETPWTPLSKPLSDCTVALISSGGIALKTDPPFDQQRERQNPWWGDPSFRVIPHTTRTEDIRVYHQHINPALGERDLNCLLPIDRLKELTAEGKVGRAAPSHYSFMGYILEPTELLERSVPAIIERLRAEQVDMALLAPA